MPTSYIEYDNREDWLAGRTKSIGASEVSAAVGLNPFMSQLELWEIKTGRKKPKDLSNVSRVVFGQNAEGLIRDLYMLEHPEFTLEYHPYRVYFQTELPFLTATLDGEPFAFGEDDRALFSIKNSQGEVVKEISLDSKIWNIEVNDDTLKKMIRLQLDSMRQGTRKTKTRT